MIPQPHRSKWTDEETSYMKESIENNATLDEIAKVIFERSHGAILTKANSLGYGNYRNKNDGLTYFKDEIKHKSRSYKDKSIPTKEADTVGNEDTDSIPKTAVDNAFYAGSVAFMLKSMKDNQCLHL